MCPLHFIIKSFQAAVEEHISVDICVEVAKFKMTLILVKLIKATENKSKPQQTVDGAVTGRQPGDRGLAYVLHTSGTTGPSKIVRVLHKCILPNILHLRLVTTILCLCCIFSKVFLSASEAAPLFAQIFVSNECR